MKIKEVSVQVKALLEQDRLLADNDNALIAKIWESELESMIIDSLIDNIDRFLEVFVAKKLTLAESIRRSRQLIEAAHVNLRGDTYEIRHGKKAKEVKEAVKKESFEQIMDGTPKYTRITKDIFENMPPTGEVYYTHPDAECWTSTQSNSWATSTLMLTPGKKYSYTKKLSVESYVDLTIETYALNPSQFSVLSLPKK